MASAVNRRTMPAPVYDPHDDDLDPDMDERQLMELNKQMNDRYGKDTSHDAFDFTKMQPVAT